MGLEELKAFGWVTGYKVEAGEERIQVSLDGLFECIHIEASNGIHASPLTRGILAGLVEASTGRRPAVHEAACVRLGADRCRFIITP